MPGHNAVLETREMLSHQAHLEAAIWRAGMFSRSLGWLPVQTECGDFRMCLLNLDTNPYMDATRLWIELNSYQALIREVLDRLYHELNTVAPHMAPLIRRLNTCRRKITAALPDNALVPTDMHTIRAVAVTRQAWQTIWELAANTEWNCSSEHDL